MAMHIETFFDQGTDTFTHVVQDLTTKKAAIIDAVLNYDQFSGQVSTASADQVLDYVKMQNLTVDWILDTHIHADHITAAHYLRSQVGGRIGIGKKINMVYEPFLQDFFAKTQSCCRFYQQSEV